MRSRPHGHEPSGNSATVSSGVCDQARCAPGAPGCLPGLRPLPGFARGAGAFRPGRSSDDGGIEELPEFRDAARRAASSCPRSSRTSPVSSASWADRSVTCADSPAISAACSRISASRGSSGGSDSDTPR